MVCRNVNQCPGPSESFYSRFCKSVGRIDVNCTTLARPDIYFMSLAKRKTDREGDKYSASADTSARMRWLVVCCPKKKSIKERLYSQEVMEANRINCTESVMNCVAFVCSHYIV